MWPVPGWGKGIMTSTRETRSRKCLNDKRIWCGKVGNRQRRDCLNCTREYTLDKGMSITRRVRSRGNSAGGRWVYVPLPAEWIGKKVEVTLVKETEEEGSNLKIPFLSMMNKEAQAPGEGNSSAQGPAPVCGGGPSDTTPSKRRRKLDWRKSESCRQ
jgi:hypothetical protein